MLISVYIRTKIDSLGREWKSKRAVLQCDHCCSEFSRQVAGTVLTQSQHYCNKTCSKLATRIGGAAFEKRRQTCIKKYGVDNVSGLDHVRKKRKATCMERYGTSEPTQSSVVKQKRRNTNLERYGYEEVLSVPEIHAKAIEGILKANRTSDVVGKRFATMKARNSFKKSAPEEKLFLMLCERFGVSDVERQIRPNAERFWSVDFYIRSLEMWIQVDGVYWHGLDGNLEFHKSRIDTDKRSKIIVYKWNVDREQERWFLDRKLCLLRITDLAIKKLTSLPDRLADIAYFDSTRHF